MDENLRGQIKAELSSRTTDELIDIWKNHDYDLWEPDTFDVIRAILLERLGEVPEISAKIALPGLFKLLEEYLKSKDYERGLRESNEAVRFAPNNAEVRNYRGLFHDYLGQPEQALEDYREAVKLDPDFENARENLLSVQNDLSEKARLKTSRSAQFSATDTSLETQIRENFRLMDSETLLTIWRDHDIDEWTPQAFDVLREVLTDRLGEVPEVTSAPTLHKTLAAIQEFSENGDDFNALNMCRKALEEAPDSPIANYLYGQVLMDMGRNSEASTAFSKTVSLDPDFKDAADLLNKLEKELDGEFKQSTAMGFLEEALEYAADEEFDLAYEEVRKAKPLLPETASASTTFGEVLLAVNHADEALEYFEKAVRLNPGYSRARTGLRDAHVQIKQQSLNSDVPVNPAEVEEVEKQAEAFDEEEFDKIQDEVEETPDWVYMGKDAVQVRGTPGHRNRAGRSGLDPLDTQMDVYRFQGGLIRRLFTGHLRTHDPVYLSVMFVAGSILLLPLLYIISSVINNAIPEDLYSMNCMFIFLIIPGLYLYYNIVLSFLSEEPEGFEDTNDKFF